MSAAKTLFGKFISEISGIFSGPARNLEEDGSLLVDEKTAFKETAHKMVSQKERRLLPNISEEQLILCRKAGEPRIETLVARLIPAMIGYLRISKGLDCKTGEASVIEFARHNCFYFSTCKASSGVIWDTISLESYRRVFDLIPFQVERIPTLAGIVILEFESPKTISVFMLQCILYIMKPMTAEEAEPVFALFGALGIDHRTMANEYRKALAAFRKERKR